MTDNIQKIVDALRDPSVMCGACTYHGEPNGCNRSYGSCDGWDYADDAAGLIEQMDAEIQRLKEKRMQKPLTLEEAVNQKAVWLEFMRLIVSGNDTMIPVLFASYCPSDNQCVFDDGEDDIAYWEDDREYGKGWRCWATKPTDEERKAAKWDDR